MNNQECTNGKIIKDIQKLQNNLTYINNNQKEVLATDVTPLVKDIKDYTSLRRDSASLLQQIKVLFLTAESVIAHFTVP